MSVGSFSCKFPPNICPVCALTACANSEIAELMAVKSKHGAGGEYSPDWRPPVSAMESWGPTNLTCL
jgi:hypothetical protein